MLIANDLVCRCCGHIDEDIACTRGSREDGWKLTTPPCSACGGSTSVSFAHGRPFTYNAFTPRVHSDKLVITSKREEELLTAKIRARFPGTTEVHYEPDSKVAQKQRADEARHIGWAERQRMGIGEDAPKEQAEIAEAVRASAEKVALSKNQEPKAAGDAAAASVPSAAELAGAVR